MQTGRPNRGARLSVRLLCATVSAETITGVLISYAESDMIEFEIISE